MGKMASKDQQLAYCRTIASLMVLLPHASSWSDLESNTHLPATLPESALFGFYLLNPISFKLVPLELLSLYHL